MFSSFSKVVRSREDVNKLKMYQQSIVNQIMIIQLYFSMSFSPLIFSKVRLSDLNEVNLLNRQVITET